MREQLKAIHKVRATFRGTVDRFGEKSGYRGHIQKTMLVKNIRDKHNRVLTDHLWFRCGKWTKDLAEGDEIQFDARVKRYSKGYRGRREDDDLPPPSVDYGLSHPSNVRKIKPVQEMPEREYQTPPMPTEQAPLFAGLFEFEQHTP